MILVTGGTGAIGARMVARLVSRGFRVRVLVLPNDPFLSRLDGVDCEIANGDITDPDSLRDAFDGVQTVYHLAAIIISRDPRVFRRINICGTENMLDAASRVGVGHFIYVSSASVVYPPSFSTPYSRSKRRCEELVKARTSMAYTIVRPTLVYDADGGQEFMMFLDYLEKFPVVPFIGSGRALKSPVHVDDLIHGLLQVAGNEKTHGKIYNLSGGEEISILDLARLMLRTSGGTRPFVRIPIPVCRALAVVMRLAMKEPPLTWNVIAGVSQDANLDPCSAVADLGYDPVGVREGLKKCVPFRHTPR